MKAIDIARVCHEVNRAYCESQGDTSQVRWDKAPEWQQKSALMGVEMHLAFPDATPADSHASWLKEKEADGWAYGEVKDVPNKLHPCMVPYEQLPDSQKAKDFIFREIVHSLKGVLTADELVRVNDVLATEATAASPQVLATMAVRYIGRRAEWTDSIYHTGLYFIQGQVRHLPPHMAKKFLRHADLFERVELTQPESVIEGTDTDVGTTEQSEIVDDTQALLEQAQIEEDAKRDDLNKVQSLYDEIGRMNSKAALATFARENYRQELDTKLKMDDLRQQCRQFVDQFGAL